MTGTQIAVFTRNLRVRDNPALAAALAPERPVVALFVIDDSLATAFRNANRASFLCDCLSDLQESFTKLGGRLVVRRGRWAAEIAAVAAETGASHVHLSGDVSETATRRLARLEAATRSLRVAVQTHPGVAVVDPSRPRTGTGTPYRVFTPYYRAWLRERWRSPLPPPGKIDFATPRSLPLPSPADITAATPSPGVARGGETRGLAQLRQFTGQRLGQYADVRDDLAADATSHISAHLHFGSLSPLEIATRLRDRPGGSEFVRQLAWRDFFHHVLTHDARLADCDLRPRGDHWNEDPEQFAAWTEGRTGYPVVDAGMRQLRAEGTMHNRARMIVASFLTKHLYLDWRLGARHFADLLTDADVAVNQLNWQWVAGTGTDPNPFRVFNPTLQSQRFDPAGSYVSRYVEELRGLDSPEIHDPAAPIRTARGYPQPIVDHRAAVARFRAVQQANRASRHDDRG